MEFGICDLMLILLQYTKTFLTSKKLYLQLLNLLLISWVQKIRYVLVIFLLISFSGYCQILDDSTKLVYSSKTTQFFKPEDILYNTNKRNNIDTSLLNLHNYNYYFRNNILYQDLGNFGTPLHRIYYEAPTSIGKKLGFTTLEEYGYNIDQLNYYDTKSPFTRLWYVQGTRGQQILEAGHTQNIKPHWNAGFTIKRMISLKQIAVGGTKEQQMSHYSFNAHTSYFSKNKRYALLFAFTHLDHIQYESGGIFVDSTETKADMFDYKLEKAQLYSRPNGRTVKTKLRSYHKSSNFRLYNEYSIIPNKGLQIFYQFDYHTNKVRYDDDYLYNIVEDYRNIGYYPTAKYDTLSTHDRIVYELYENKIGLKGSASKLFYMAYLRRRDLGYFQTNYEQNKRRYNENYVGGAAVFRFTDTTVLSAKAEYLLGKDYLLKFDFTSRFLDIGYQSISYSPSIFQLTNISNSYQWENNFSNTLNNFFYATGKLKAGSFLQFSPFVNYHNVYNLIYYNSSAVPEQYNGSIHFTSAGFWGQAHWKILYLENYLRYTKTAGADIWRVPELFNHARVYVYGALFKKALRLQFGVDLYWKSSYYGNAYSPATQQFYLSDKTSDFNLLDGYLLGDVFLNTQIKRGYIFLKLSHANQGFPSPGYFITPYYTGLPRSFEFGVRWLFYD